MELSALFVRLGMAVSSPCPCRGWSRL